jgi:transposase
MIIPPGPLRVIVATKPVDFRKGAIGLAALVEHELPASPSRAWPGYSVRSGRTGSSCWCGMAAAWCWSARFSGPAAFHWPRIGDGVMRLSAAQMSALFEGLQRSRMHVPATLKPVAAQ